MLRRDGLPFARATRARRHRDHREGFACGAHPHRRPRKGDRRLPQQRRPRLHRHPGRAPEPGKHPADLGLSVEGFRKEAAAERADAFAAEAEGLEALRVHVRVPQVLDLGVKDGKAFIVLEHLDLRRSGDYAALGRMLAKLHRQTGPRFGWARDNYIGLAAQQNGWCDDWMEFWETHRIQPQLLRAKRNGFALE